MASLARSALRISSRASTPAPPSFARRAMSGGGDAAYHQERVNHWAKVSLAGIGAIAVLSCTSLYIEIEHQEHKKHHPHEIRSKPFPWKCSDCTFIPSTKADMECYAQCMGGEEE